MPVNELLRFIRKSPTAFHAVESLTEDFSRAGFTRLQEREPWRLTPGGLYFVTRNRSSVIAFTVPENGFAPFMICASHSDSPTFKIKENAEIEVRGKYVQLDVERYGGSIFSTWMDRPLSVAGRALVKTDAGLETRLVNVDRDLVMIPNVAIHMNREVNNGYKYNLAVDTMPLFGGIGAKGGFRRVIAEACGAREEDIAGCDLYLYNRMPGTVWGAQNEFVSCGQLDDLECAFTSSRALLAARPARHISLCCVFDNEEVGSTTKQGADSSFLTDTVRRIAMGLGADEEALMAALASSFMLSADNAHATHPNHPEYADPQNQVFMNEGIVIKFNASQRYTTDAVSAAVFHRVLEDAGVPFQHYANRSDLPGGGTLGNISGSHLSVNTLDIGLAQLAMHSSYETAGVRDVQYMIDGIRAFYETDVQCGGDGCYSLRREKA
ncbi:MAG: M18 family aminopeptidase [Clostridia bacterium]|nr:M18 family aminopeptidase [Clostridia bacterium]